MSACEVLDTRAYGFAALEMANAFLSLQLIPHFGGKLVSLFDRRHEREWLWTNPYLAHLQPIGLSHPREQFELGGWDECFPAIAPGAYPAPPWTGFQIPDHGDLWARDWLTEVLDATPECASVRQTVEGDELPYVFERTLALRAGEPALRVQYAVRNTGEAELPFVWSSHPLLRVLPDMAIDLPPGTRVWVSHALPEGTLPAGLVAPWPHAPVRGEPFDLSRVPPGGSGWAAKLYTSPLTEGWVALRDAWQGRALRFRFNPGEVPAAGLWLNYGGWSGNSGRPLYTVGIEPCIGGADDLPLAMRRGEFAALPPGGERRWELAVEVA